MAYKDPAKQREYQRCWMQKRRQEWFDENGPCVLCGSDEDLEIDHIDPTIKVSHSVWSWSQERREVELAKCQVLCAKCHRVKSNRQLTKTTHGRHWMYQQGCRCDECKRAKSEVDAKYRQGKGG